MSYTNTSSETYSVVDIENVFRRITADFVMIATSTGGASEESARKWAHDAELLAKKGYLKSIDLTLFSNGVEEKAVQYEVDTTSGALTMSRPGGVRWPKVNNPNLRINLIYTAAYTTDARAKLAGQLKINWEPSYADLSHSSLTGSDGRSYSSNGYGIQRKDFA